jgi:hypothetical protein
MKIIVFCTSLLLFFSCGGNANDNKRNTNNKKEDVAVDTANQEVEEEKFVSGLNVSYKNFKSEKCFEPDPEDEYGEPFCAEIKVKQMLVSMTDSKVAEKINAVIFKSITDKPMGSTSMKKWVSKVQEVEGIYEASSEEITCSSDLQTEDFLCMSISWYSFSYGAAHPIGSISHFNFDLRTGKKLTLDDLLTDGYKKELKRLGEKAFIKTNGSSGWEFTPGRGDFFLPDNFSITKKGLMFTYGQYEIGPYAAGSPDVLIRYDQISQFIPDDSHLLKFLEIKKK